MILTNRLFENTSLPEITALIQNIFDGKTFNYVITDDNPENIYHKGVDLSLSDCINQVKTELKKVQRTDKEAFASVTTKGSETILKFNGKKIEIV